MTRNLSMGSVLTLEEIWLLRKVRSRMLYPSQSCEAELRVMVHITCELVWIKSLLKEFDLILNLKKQWIFFICYCLTYLKLIIFLFALYIKFCIVVLLLIFNLVSTLAQMGSNVEWLPFQIVIIKEVFLYFIVWKMNIVFDIYGKVKDETIVLAPTHLFG